MRLEVLLSLALWANGSACAMAPPLDPVLEKDVRSTSDGEILLVLLAQLRSPRSDKVLVVGASPVVPQIDPHWVESKLAAHGVKKNDFDLESMLANHKERNSPRYELPSFPRPSQILSLSSEDLHLMFSDGAFQGWDRFHSRFPAADALILFTLPGYSKSGSWAIVCSFVDRGPRAGDFNVNILHWTGGGWRLEWTEMLFAT